AAAKGVNALTIFDLFWLFLILSWMLPAYQRWRTVQQRLAMTQKLRRMRGSRIITLLHRQEPFGFLGLFQRRFISIEDSEQILRAIRSTPKDVPIDLILHTPGGLVLASEQIARALQKHEARTAVFIPHYAMSGGTMIALAADELWMDEHAVVGPIDLILHTPGGLVLASEQIARALQKHEARTAVFIPHYAMSGGTMIALAADELWMDEHAVVGPIDPQIGGYPAASILKVVEEKPISEVDDNTLIMADLARKAVRQVEDTVTDLLKGTFPAEPARALARTLTAGRWTHDYPIRADQLQAMGFTVRTDLPEEIYALMDLYPQPQNQRPSVTYSPLPPTGRPNEEQ